MSSALDRSEVLLRKLNATPESFIGGIRFELRWDASKFCDLCLALQAATKAQCGTNTLARDLSQLFWYCGTFVPLWVQQRDFAVGQPDVNHEKACSLLRRLGDAWFGDDSRLADEELAERLADI